MKHFTKLALSAAFSLFAVTGAYAQDGGIIQIDNPGPGTQVYPNLPTTPEVTMQNFGSSAINNAVADTVIFIFSVNGTQVLESYGFPTSTGIPAGGTTPWTFNDQSGPQQIDWSTLGLGNNMVAITLCSKTELRKGSGGSNIDINTSNDEFCSQPNDYAYAGDNNPLTYDLAPINLTCSVPNYAAGANVPLGGAVLTISYDLQNAGTNQIPDGVPYTYDVSVAGTAVATNINAAVINPLSGGGTEPHVLEFGTPITFPLTPGPFDMCMKLAANPDDTDASNDETCTQYIAGNPQSVEDFENSPLYGNISYFQDVLKIEFTNVASGIANAELYDISGRQINEYQFDVDLEKNKEFDMSELQDGIYIFNITVNGDLMTYKFKK